MSDETTRDETIEDGTAEERSLEVDETDVELEDAEDDADAHADARAGDVRRDAVVAAAARAGDLEADWRARLRGSAAAAAAIAALTLLLTVVRMNETDVSGQTGPAQTLGATFDFYLVPALVLFFLLWIAGYLGVFRSWLTGLLAGALAGAVASILGYALRVLLGGQVALTGEVWSIIVGQVLGLFFPFLVFSALLGAVAGPWIWRRMLRADVLEQEAAARRASGFAPLPDDGKVALVRIPAENMDEAELTHLERTPIDLDLANEQWESYVATLEEHGWVTREVPAAPTMADSVFVEDHVVVLGDVAILARTGAASRRAELPGVRAALAAEELVEVELEAPATLDGGDVLVIDETVYVGASSRTNAEGIRQLRRIAGDLGYRTVAVPVRGALHLKTAATALPDGTVVANPDAFDGPLPFPRVLRAEEPLGASVLPLDAGTVAVSAAAPKTAAAIRRLGYEVVELDVSEFEKAEGGLTCLSARIV